MYTRSLTMVLHGMRVALFIDTHVCNPISLIKNMFCFRQN